MHHDRTKVSAYYNERDRDKAEWLRELIKAGVIAPGVVDERSITDVLPADLVGYTQCHFFAGIGVWSYALRLAGWPDDRPSWTASLPCQPFSAISQKRKRTEDERHLWPVFHFLVRERRPPTIFGEQVSSPDGIDWFHGVRADLEASGYAVGGSDLCAAGVGAPEIRQRLYWMGHSKQTGLEGLDWNGDPGHESRREFEEARRYASAAVRAGYWDRFETAWDSEGKRRRVEPGTFPLVDGPANRVVKLRGFGDAIVAPLAAEFIAAAIEVIG